MLLLLVADQNAQVAVSLSFLSGAQDNLEMANDTGGQDVRAP